MLFSNGLDQDREIPSPVLCPLQVILDKTLNSAPPIPYLSACHVHMSLILSSYLTNNICSMNHLQ